MEWKWSSGRMRLGNYYALNVEVDKYFNALSIFRKWNLLALTDIHL